MNTKQTTMPKATTKTSAPAAAAVQHRRFTGTVVRAKAVKTIAVRVDTKTMHPKYRKQYATSRNYLVHDEKGIAKVGDMVVFEECRPLSKLKRWRLLSLVKSS